MGSRQCNVRDSGQPLRAPVVVRPLAALAAAELVGGARRARRPPRMGGLVLREGRLRRATDWHRGRSRSRALPGSENHLILQLIGEAVEVGRVKAWLQRRLMNRKVIELPARRGLGKVPSQGIVDHLFPRRPRAASGLVDESNHVGIKGQGGAHIGIMLSSNVGIKMPHQQTSAGRAASTRLSRYWAAAPRVINHEPSVGSHGVAARH
jgi:hypothetical protein